MGITEQLIKFSQAEVPEEAAAMMRLSLFDWAACGVAGANEAEFASFRRAQMVEEGPAHIFGGDAAGAATAALVNGTLSHALDYDDTHFAHIGHPSVAVLPAVMALAETLDISLTEAIDAATIGVEASILTGVWLGRSHYQIGYHQTATAGAFGATLAAARVLGLDKHQLRHALGLCASMASGVKEQFGTMAKPLNAGLAARTGVEAALWAQAGMSAAHDGLAGPLGFGATHHGEAAEVKLPRKEWQINTISHKFHACCHGLHAMLEALSGLDVQTDQIAAIKVRTHPRWMSVCNIAEPKTGLEAKFSYRQTAAMALLGHATGAVDNFTDALAKNAEVKALREKIDVVEDDSLSETQAQVTLTLTSGGVRRLRHDLMAPISLEQRSEKLRSKVKALIGEDRTEGLWQAVIGSDLDAVSACFAGNTHPESS
ncbi:MmgE/PrpD family protein [Sulfitobacter donghicola]|uniref:2-methylcitrate dehydratase n=1 Tax=Sulfitobacter donghicola DSW-25 = KCTC 12864 = JCM 14565 TaxID=1300350 RepID=A0A073ISN0_9RHOB|nr:MmgE/PrpD family protein [Sulfitobacter donghicola]KEJ88407.1 2-methylcitrate dehydratase [Sulfitobacter donghicola DSW-25 = KCTC 12864 = JCM 14565]KIN69726.1 MmgE/PrpD family protein [Sulfitobacter donghicola DSW-25 = KCTC 12864 = JCM 14565]